MSARLALVRHGETVNHAENRYTGLSDVELTDRGRQQADELAAWARGADLSAVWTSPLSRCRLTAASTATELGIEPIADDRLRELDFGALDGLTITEARALLPEQTAAFLADPVAHCFPGGEPPAQAASRAVQALQDIAGRHDGQRVLVVAHSTLIRLALCDVLGIPLRRYRTVFPELGNCTLTEVQIDGATASLLRFNGQISGAAKTTINERESA